MKIFNDMLFESYEAQEQFNALAATHPVEYVDKLRSVLGKPSQFVGRVTSWEKAITHWEAWDAYEREELKRKFEEEQASKPQKKLKVPKVPKPPKVPSGKPPGRPSTKDPEVQAALLAEVEEARRAWKEAVALVNHADVTWAEWERGEITKIRQQAGEAHTARHNWVRQLKETLRAAKAKL